MKSTKTVMPLSESVRMTLVKHYSGSKMLSLAEKTGISIQTLRKAVAGENVILPIRLAIEAAIKQP